jgi:hypothetical protein
MEKQLFLLDCIQIFTGFVLKQLEAIEEGQINNAEELIPHIFQFLVLLSYENYHSKVFISTYSSTLTVKIFRSTVHFVHRSSSWVFWQCFGTGSGLETDSNGSADFLSYEVHLVQITFLVL